MGQPRRIELEGKLHLEEQEGGFCTPCVIIGGKAVDDAIAEMLGIPGDGRASADCDKVPDVTLRCVIEVVE